jgi:hypothetical protein
LLQPDKPCDSFAKGAQCFPLVFIGANPRADFSGGRGERLGEAKGVKPNQPGASGQMAYRFAFSIKQSGKSRKEKS